MRIVYNNNSENKPEPKIEKQFVDYHCFIAHASDDLNKAIELYNHLSSMGKRVFLDAVSLKPGDLWDYKLKKAQTNALVTIILVSNNSGNAYYLQEEIAEAIDLSRRLNRRIIPVYLDNNIENSKVPYGLKRIHGLFYSKTKGLNKIATEIVEVIENFDEEKIHVFTNSYATQHQINLERVLAEKVNSRFENTLVKLDEFKWLADCRNWKASIIFFDIDGMTQLNKYHGKEIADKVNEKVHCILNETALGTMMTNKLGTDEYIAASVNCSLDNAFMVAKSIRDNICRYDWYKIKYDLRVRASFGVAQLVTKGSKLSTDGGTNIEGETVNEWLVRAIFGCREAKKRGGNKVLFGPKILPEYISQDLNIYFS